MDANYEAFVLENQKPKPYKKHGVVSFLIYDLQFCTYEIVRKREVVIQEGSDI